MIRLLIHSVDQQPRPVAIIVFTYVVRPSIPTFQNLAIQNKFQAKKLFTTGETVGLAEWIMYDTCLVFHYSDIHSYPAQIIELQEL